jgi:hypothetical protein
MAEFRSRTLGVFYLLFVPVANYYTTYGFRKCSFSYNLTFFSTGISSSEQFIIDFERRVQNNPTRKSNTSFCNGTPQYRYKEQVFYILHDTKLQIDHLNSSELHSIQEQIEKLSMDFEEYSLLKSVPKVLEKLVFEYELSAKATILSKKDLDTEIRDAVLQMDSYTL